MFLFSKSKGPSYGSRCHLPTPVLQRHHNITDINGQNNNQRTGPLPDKPYIHKYDTSLTILVFAKVSPLQGSLKVTT